ncbi:MAG: S8 family serine peptidase [Gammaproteobacteria bacterium]|nr:S8 family serine peptidase [Gammaproteobacteria bacterium]
MTGPLSAAHFLSRFPSGNSGLPGRHGQAMCMLRNLAMTVVLGLFVSGCGGGSTAGAGKEGMQWDQTDSENDRSEERPEENAGESAEETLRRAYAAHPEFRNQYGLSRIRADHAYARGATGEGITLGIVDSGIDSGHPKFEGRLETHNLEGYDPDFSECPHPASDGTCTSNLGHGTFVGGIMAAGRRENPDGDAASEAAVHGVAFDSRVISVGFPSLDEIIEEILPEENPTAEQIRDLQEAVLGIEARLEEQFAEAFTRLNGRVTAVNGSFGLPGNIEAFTAEELRRRFPNVIGAIAQSDTPAEERTVYVWAAGNARGEINDDGSVESGSSVEIVAGLPVRIPELRGHSLAVVATDPEGRIADFSNRCGIAGAFCLAAPGVDIVGPVPGFYCPGGTKECYRNIREAGTSSAAPFVTGGIGLLAQYYRGQLGNDGIVRRLLATADRTGIYADAGVYGRGFLDLDAATRPVGETRMLTGDSLSGPSAPDRHSFFRPGAAFGDALARGLSSIEVAGFDELDAPFFRSLGDFLRSGSWGRLGLEDRLRALGRDPRGTGWQMGSVQIRLRIDAAPESLDPGPRSGQDVPGISGNVIPGASGGLVPGVPGSFSLMHDTGGGKLWFGYRVHPGWYFGPFRENPDGMVDHGIGWIEPGTFTDGDAFANPWPGFARGGISFGVTNAAATLRIAAFHGTAQSGDRVDPHGGEALGFLAEYRFGRPGGTGYAIQGGLLAESGGVAGSRLSGAFGKSGSDTGVVGLSVHRPLGDRWGFLAGAYAGLSDVGMSPDGMVRDVSGLWGGAFSFGFIGKERGRLGGRMGIRLSQPLRVESGHAGLRWVSGRTPDGQVESRQATVDLEPSGRQLDLELAYSRPWAGGQAHLAGVASRDAGHVRGAREAVFLFRYRRAF